MSMVKEFGPDGLSSSSLAARGNELATQTKARRTAIPTEMQREIEIEQARQYVAGWLRERAPSLWEDFDVNEDRNVPEELHELVQRFFEISNRKEFSWIILQSSKGCVVRWSHPRCKASAIAVAKPASREEEAQLLACAELLRHAECRSLLEH